MIIVTQSMYRHLIKSSFYHIECDFLVVESRKEFANSSSVIADVGEIVTFLKSAQRYRSAKTSLPMTVTDDGISI